MFHDEIVSNDLILFLLFKIKKILPCTNEKTIEHYSWPNRKSIAKNEGRSRSLGYTKMIRFRCLHLEEMDLYLFSTHKSFKFLILIFLGFIFAIRFIFKTISQNQIHIQQWASHCRNLLLVFYNLFLFLI